jgi:hypothetical protein
VFLINQKITKLISNLYFIKENISQKLEWNKDIARSNEIPGWEGVGNRQLLCFFKT